MCDPVLIAAILEELGYFDEKKEKEKKEEFRGGISSKNRSENSTEEKHEITHLFMPDPASPMSILSSAALSP